MSRTHALLHHAFDFAAAKVAREALATHVRTKGCVPHVLRIRGGHVAFSNRRVHEWSARLFASASLCVFLSCEAVSRMRVSCCVCSFHRERRYLYCLLID